MSVFQVGKTYTTRSVCDHDCIIYVPVLRRTEKTLTTLVRGEEKTLHIIVWKGVECVKPWGTYSMSPIVSAED